jgi:hypothetical protein
MLILDLFNNFGFEVFMSMPVKNAVISPCSSEKVRCLVGIYRPHLQGLKVNQPRNHQKQAARWDQHLEDGSDIFLQNFSLSLNYMTLQPRRPYCSQSLLWEPLIWHNHWFVSLETLRRINSWNSCTRVNTGFGLTMDLMNVNSKTWLCLHLSLLGSGC